MITALLPDWKTPGSGKGHFLYALAANLHLYGVKPVISGKHDIVLDVTRIKSNSDKKHVIRMDGVYHDTGVDYTAKNATMADGCRRSSAVICQSVYGKNMVMRYLGVDEDKISVVYNGAVSGQEYSAVGKEYEYEFVTASRWRPHKRLLDTIEAFLEANIEGSCLRIFGDFGKGMNKYDYSKYKSIDNIIWHGGAVDRPVMFGHVKNATAMVHLCGYDCCPNSVVEAICLGTPVICSNIGGTPEIVSKSGGFCVAIDEKYDYSPIDLYHLPIVDCSLVAAAMVESCKNRPEITSDHVSITSSAKGYANILKKVLCS